ncbi:hypothetical protein GCM10023232_27350 [Sphingosinicella ginsenosidimutans]|uniref:Lipoprotein n=1 Tax=Allosphingosinicella ginsenosidimutans TaxID=1176539 RepID=A0A5C6TUU7_9SPHN|nr:hypothetical protein [Sphingosinicella ginsenosidimutans]TXC63665.1 hypothetical protein FRZ32_08335 [Sphingosinicella ginsenosidimutans]
MRLIAILATLMLAACQQQGADGYAFERSEFDRREIVVTVVEHPSLADLRADAARRGVSDGNREIMAFGLVAADRPACEIHIVDPARDYRPEWIGHELTHCIRGRWHG